MINYDDRIKKAREYMNNNGIDGLFLNPSGDAEYLTGIRRQRPNATHSHLPGDWVYGLYLNQKDCIYLAPKMTREFVESQVKDKKFINDIIIMDEGIDFGEYAKKVIEKLGLGEGAIAAPKTALGKTLINFKIMFPNLKFVNTEDFTCKMRMIKDEEELERMIKAAQITDEVFEVVLSKLKVGMSEIEIGAEVDYQMLLKGAEGTSFTTGILIKGKNKSSVIEDIGRTGNARLEVGDTLAFDFGVVYEGYCSDFGRTVYVGEPTKKIIEVHNLIMDSQKAAIEVMVGGKITAEELDKTARSIIENAGYGEEFYHRLGHGIGIDVHEYPYLNIGYKEVLQNNMTFTIEPSILIPGELWIRVEDVVQVTPNGGNCINKASKEIICI